MSFFCKKRHESMDDACADCEDCPGSGELQAQIHKPAMKLEDVFEIFGGLVHGGRES